MFLLGWLKVYFGGDLWMLWGFHSFEVGIEVLCFYKLLALELTAKETYYSFQRYRC